MSALTRVPDVLLGATAIAIVTIILAEIFLRTYIGTSLDQYQEIVRLLFAWLTYVGAAILVRRGGHYRVTLVWDRIGEEPRAALAFFADVVILIVAVVFLVEGVKTVLITAPEQMPVSRMSQGWYSASLVAGSVLMILYALASIVVSGRAFVRIMAKALKG